jgi:hypothetical protein
MSGPAARSSKKKVAIPGGKGLVDLPRMAYLKTRSGREGVAAWSMYLHSICFSRAAFS